MTPRIQANSVGEGNIRVDAWLAPTPAISGAYGLTKRLDIGMDAEQLDMLSIWSRYSLVNRESVALAATAGVFGKNNSNNSRGYFVGSVFSGRINERLKLYSGYRFSQVNYEPVDMNQQFLSDDDLYSGVDSRDSDDLSSTSQLHLGFTITLPSKAEINLGAGCQYHHRNNDSQIRSRPCGPLIGITVRTGHK